MSEETEGFDSRAELALNLRWSWNDASDEVWRQLDSELWELTHNPWVVCKRYLETKSSSCLPILSSAKTSTECSKQGRQGMAEPAWFQKTHPNTFLRCAAYLSMEFMLSEALRIYSGGLGNVAESGSAIVRSKWRNARHSKLPRHSKIRSELKWRRDS